VVGFVHTNTGNEMEHKKTNLKENVEEVKIGRNTSEEKETKDVSVSYPGIESLRNQYLSLSQKKSENLISSHGFHFLCCLDSSPINSSLVYHVTRSFKKKTDLITIFHAYSDRERKRRGRSEDEDDDEEEWTPDTLYEKYLQESSFENKNSVFLCWESKENGSFGTLLTEYLDMCSEVNNTPNFLVLGLSSSSYSSHSTMTHLLNTHPYSLILVKKEIPLRREKKFWMMAIDGTLSSQQGLTLLFHLIQPKDTLLLFHLYDSSIETNIQLTKVSNYYEDELATSGPAICNFIVLEQEDGGGRGEHLSTSIVNFVNENHPDVFAMATTVGKVSASGVMEHIIHQVDCSMVIFKC
jgi:hypothetical protein